MLQKKANKIALRWLFIPLLFLLCAPINLISLSTPAAAITKSSTMTAPQRVQSWIYRQAILQCIQSGELTTNEAQIEAGHWFSNTGNAPAMYFSRTSLTTIGSDGKTNCDENNNELMSDALSFWDIDPLTFICSVPGVSRVSQQSCTQGSGDFNIIGKNNLLNAFKNYLSTNVYDGGSPFSVSIAGNNTVDGLSPTEQYYFYLTTLQQSCIRGDGSLSQALDKDPGGADVYSVKILATALGESAPITKYYIGQKHLSDAVEAYPSGTGLADPAGGIGGHGNYSLTCKQIADRVNSNAQAAADSLNYAAAKTSCTDAGFTKGNFLACMLGAANQGNTEAWCKGQSFSTITTGETKAELVAACTVGLGVVKTIVDPKEDTCKSSSTCDSSQTSCAPEGIGWIICPISNAIAGMTDGLFNIVSELMRVQPIIGSGDYQKNLQNAWGTMRNIANVAFVIAFLIIIFSQLTSVGINNYGVKKLLPRIVISAILVNLSFFICAVLVDLSNIFGVGVQDLLINLRSEASLGSNPDGWSNLVTAILGSGTLVAAGFTYVVVTGASTLWAAVGGLLILMISALLALAAAFLVLIFRQALIIILIIIAPLAFVAYLLPNTESLYKKWQSTFVTLLVFFPLMSLVFGGSQLASSFIMASAKTDNPVGLFMYMGALAIQVIPLFLAPVLLKLSSGVLGRFAGMVNNPNGGLVDRGKKALQSSVDASNARGLAGSGRFGKIARNFDRRTRKREFDKKSYEAQSEQNWNEQVVTDPKLRESYDRKASAESANNLATGAAQAGYTQRIQADPALQAAAAGNVDIHGEAKAVAGAIEAQRKAYESTVSSYSVAHADKQLSEAELTKIVRDQSVSVEEREAASRGIVQAGNIDAITSHQDYLSSQLQTATLAGNSAEIGNIQKLQKAYADTIGSSPGKPMGLGANEIASFKTGTYVAAGGGILSPIVQTDGTVRQATATDIQTIQTIEGKGVSMDKWATMDKSDIDRITELAKSGVISPQRSAELKDTIKKTLKDVRWSGRIQEREKQKLKDLQDQL
jgi:hypothetical protein